MIWYLVPIGVLFYATVAGIVWRTMDDSEEYHAEEGMFFGSLLWPITIPVWLGYHIAPALHALGPSGRRDRAYKKREWARQEQLKVAQHQVEIDKLALEQARMLDEAIKRAKS